MTKTRIPKTAAFRELLRKARLLRVDLTFHLADGTPVSRAEADRILKAAVLAEAARAS